MSVGSDKPIALEERSLEQGRMRSPSAGRNRDAICAVLSELLPSNAHVIEIASGTGEHALACVQARPDIIWQPSDPDATSRVSVDAWASQGDGRIRPCLDIDTTVPGWAKGSGPYQALFCANMIHIAPFEAAIGIFQGAQTALDTGGIIHLYGPFKEGEATTPSNLDFDASLKARDPRWGVRELSEVEALARANGFHACGRRDMPANNLILSFEKA